MKRNEIDVHVERSAVKRAIMAEVKRVITSFVKDSKIKHVKLTRADESVELIFNINGTPHSMCLCHLRDVKVNLIKWGSHF